jgi:hypothetical protein
VVDDEFPIRNPGTGIATTTTDDEFPIRNPGTSIASPPPVDEVPEFFPALEQQQPQPEPQLLQQEQHSSPEGFHQPEEHSPSPQDEQMQEQEPQLEKELEQRADEPQPEPVPEPEPELDHEHAPPQHQEDEQSDKITPPPVASASAGPSELVHSTVPEPASDPPSVPRSGSPISGLPVRTSPPQRHSPPGLRQPKPPSTLRYSTVSDVPTEQAIEHKDGKGKASPPQRKKSTLRSALGRLFGRKKKNSQDSTGAPSRSSDPVASAQHRSVSVISHINSRDGLVSLSAH